MWVSRGQLRRGAVRSVRMLQSDQGTKGRLLFGSGRAAHQLSAWDSSLIAKIATGCATNRVTSHRVRRTTRTL